MSRPYRNLFDRHGAPRLVFPGLAVLLAAFLVALGIITAWGRGGTPEERAEALLLNGKVVEAEAAYAKLVRERPTVPLVLALIDAHQKAVLFHELAKPGRDADRDGEDAKRYLPPADPPMSDADVAAIVETLPADIKLLARFRWHEPHQAIPAAIPAPEEPARDGAPTAPTPTERTEAAALRAEVEDAAKREPPLPWTNHVLGLAAFREGKPERAAELFLREGLAFPERRDDVDVAILAWMSLDAWEEIRERMQDPRVVAATTDGTKYRIAVHERDVKGAIRHLLLGIPKRYTTAGLVMSAIAALGWAFFCARLGKVGGRPRFRIPLYVAAFVLGVLSIAPTAALIAIEETRFRIVATGDPGRDVLFFVFGVGFREEAAKLLLFMPLVPVLRRWGDKLDVLVCGAFVGLGFAAEENLGYLADADVHTGLMRFLTANFFHMAMTGILASAVYDFVADRERHAAEFSRTTLFVVMIHGGYDFFLSHPMFGGPYIAMMSFVFLTRMFLRAVEAARRRADRGLTPVHAFVFATAVVTGVSLAQACVAVGPKYAAVMMAEGLLGVVLIVAVFVQTLRSL